MSNLYSFQGKVYAAERGANGKPLAFTWLANVPALTLELSTETTEKTESHTGNRLQIGRLSRAKTASLSMTLDEWTAYNIALALYGTRVAIDAGTVTAEALPSPLAAGDVIRLDNPFVADLVLTADGTALTEATDYSVESAAAGLVSFATAQAGTVTAAYSYDAAEAFTMFTAAPPERWIMLDGINTEDNSRVVVDLFRCRFDPVGTLDLINDEYGSLELSGSVLYDERNAGDGLLGGYGRIVQAVS